MRDLVARTGSRRASAVRELVARVDSATPPGRDRALDALRALAILGVVLGHWLVTALVSDSGTVRVTSPLRYLPALTPISWVFQSLAVFFLVGGMVGVRGQLSARAKGLGYGRWLRARMGRLFRPVAAVLVVWTVAAVVMLAAGTGLDTVRTLVMLVLSPMWFLLVYAALTAATPLVTRLHPLWPAAVVACVDLVRFGPHWLDMLGRPANASGGLGSAGGPEWLGWVNVAAGWLVPYCLGAVWARGGLRGRGAAWGLLAGGGVATVVLVAWAGYPAAMVGVPGAATSNLDPPSLAAVTFGVAQCGAALLLLGPLRRLLRRPAAWAAVATANLAAMTIFLWHQTAMIAVTEVGLLATVGAGRALPGLFGDGGALPGLHTVPDGPGWVLARLAWLPVFALALLVCCAAFHAYESRRTGASARAASRSPR